MRNFVVKLTMILIFIASCIVTSEAQRLLPSTEDQPEKIRSHQDKLDYLKNIKSAIEIKQGRVRQDTLPPNEDGRSLSPVITQPKFTQKGNSKNKEQKKHEQPE